MAIEIKIENKKLLFKKPKLTYQELTSIDPSIQFGVANQFFVLDKDFGPIIDNQWLISYSTDETYLKGRGFQVYIDKDNQYVLVSINLPTIPDDIRNAFKYALAITKYYDAKSVQIDNVSYSIRVLQENSIYINDVIQFNMKTINQIIQQENTDYQSFTIYGSFHPVVLSIDNDLKPLRELSPINQVEAFTKLLNNRQLSDAYYMNPLIYKDNDTETLHAFYVLTEGVQTIIPKESYIPFVLSDHLEKDDVKSWEIQLMIHDGDDVIQYQKMPYQSFMNLLSKDDIVTLDVDHYIINGLNKEQIDMLTKKQEEE